MKHKNSPVRFLTQKPNSKKQDEISCEKDLQIIFPSSLLVSEVNYHLHPGFRFYYLLPPFLLQQNFAQIREKAIFIQMDYTLASIFLNCFLKKEVKAAK